MDNQKIRIKLRSFDHRLLEKATKDMLFTIKRAGANVSGPIPLPKSIERFTVNRSPHVDKKSREQFEIRTQKRLLVINHPTTQAVDALKKINLASGVDVDIQLIN
ncbi:30S ribosomal protein S10 [Rickettsia endosymbiont of Cardiosporidium cionae]|uniref:30S ribosomal protein S10 n=1 Tax=Rickettsia endosymbiont of Cardiosporidium cionae TaxID=2777155 RepID=UPI001893B942|nr:30S ribosomal protein S10 [Rickettsia endosymbiont of Cardiosporidium cionae]KAF8818203.1 30S ribosomal protein S10 [Rickettsia endosymbiont of Cardiosporidium cionae]